MMITRSLTWLSGNGDPIKSTGHIAMVGTSLAILSAGILGYTALFDLFNLIGLFHPILVTLFPLLFDFAEITDALICITLSTPLQIEKK